MGKRRTTAVNADRFVPDDERRRARETGDEAQVIPFLNGSSILNVAQNDGLLKNLVAALPAAEPGQIEPTVDALIRASTGQP